MPRNTVLVVGAAGKVGFSSVQYLAASGIVNRLYLIDIRSLESATNNAILISAFYDKYPLIKPIQHDIMDIDKTAKILREIKPTVIFNAATIFSSMFYKDIAKKIIKKRGLTFKAHVPGHTIAKDLVPIYKLMQAVKESGIETKVVNIAFPDHTHPILAKVDLSPTVGGGNIDLIVSGMKRVLADEMGIASSRINITMVAHHAITVWPPEEVPYFIKIIVDGVDITKQFDKSQLDHYLFKAQRLQENDVDNTPMAAASGIRNVLAILNDEGCVRHCPGPNGLLGGYPTYLDSEGAKVILPRELSMEKATEINIAGMRRDGIEQIENDGTVIFTKECIAFMEEVLNLRGWEKMKIEEAELMAKELLNAYTQLAEKA